MILCTRENNEERNNDENETLDFSTLSTMRLKEEGEYRCENYMVRLKGLRPSEKYADEVCRKLMASWTFKVVDRCGFSDETAAIAVNILDRYLMTNAGLSALKDRDIFQLASMTCLYTAVKIHEVERFHSETIQSLSQGAHTKENVEKMELSILFAIQWKCHPPTPLAFVRYLLEIHTPLSQKDQRWICDLTKLPIKLVVIEYGCICNKASTIALAVLANVVESLQFDSSYLGDLASILSRVDEDVGILRRQLQDQVQAKFPNTINNSIPHKYVTTKNNEATAGSDKKSFDSRVGVSSPREVCF